MSKQYKKPSASLLVLGLLKTRGDAFTCQILKITECNVNINFVKEWYNYLITKLGFTVKYICEMCIYIHKLFFLNQNKVSLKTTYNLIYIRNPV